MRNLASNSFQILEFGFPSFMYLVWHLLTILVTEDGRTRLLYYSWWLDTYDVSDKFPWESQLYM